VFAAVAVVAVVVAVEEAFGTEFQGSYQFVVGLLRKQNLLKKIQGY
jgi:hypothetical protein